MFLRNLAHFNFYQALVKDSVKENEMMSMLAPDKNTQQANNGHEHLGEILQEFSGFINESADLNAVNLYLLAKV